MLIKVSRSHLIRMLIASVDDLKPACRRFATPFYALRYERIKVRANFHCHGNIFRNKHLIMPVPMQPKDSFPFQKMLFSTSCTHPPCTPDGTSVQRILSLQNTLLYYRKDTRNTLRKFLSFVLHSILLPGICTSFPAYSHNKLFLHLTLHDPGIRFSSITLRYYAVLHLTSRTDELYISDKRHNHFHTLQSPFPSLSSFLITCPGIHFPIVLWFIHQIFIPFASHAHCHLPLYITLFSRKHNITICTKM